MRKFKIISINLLKLYLFILLNIICSLSITFLLIYLLRYFLQGDVLVVLGITFNFILALVFHKYLFFLITKDINIYLNKKELKFNIDNTEIIFEIKNIEKHKTSGLRYPTFKVKSNENKQFKFKCSNRIDDVFDKFIIEFEKIMDKTKSNK